MNVRVKLYDCLSASAFDGYYLRSFHPEANDGFGGIVMTDKPQEAMQFRDAGEVLALRNTVPANRPTRDDGQPNRPLSAFHMEIEAVE